MMKSKFRFAKILSFMLALLLMTGTLTAFAKDTGEIFIETEADWLQFIKDCTLDSYSRGKTFVLKNDLDLTNEDNPIVPYFAGTFLGENHRIKYNMQANGEVMGLFRYVGEKAQLKNLNVEGSIYPGGSKKTVGGIVGENSGTVDGCHFAGNMLAEDNVGGIAGTNTETGVIKNSGSKALIGGTHYTGGVAGFNSGRIENCYSDSSINTVSREVKFDIESFDKEKLNNTENMAAHTDTGGIAGFSEGEVLYSVNRGEVGYNHVGYNVGGICGRQRGFMLGCKNYGTVLGRKDVGGVVGQMEPYLTIIYDKDVFEKLDTEMDILQESFDDLISHTKGMTHKVTKSLNEIGRHLSRARGYVFHHSDDANIFERLEKAHDELGKAQNEMYHITSALNNGSNNISDDTDKINSSISNIRTIIRDTKRDVLERDENLIDDISDVRNSKAEDGKIYGCENFAHIEADTNCGGIAGNMEIEYDIDPEVDFNVEGETSLNSRRNSKNTMIECVNHGEIKAKKNSAGGIVGDQTRGAVIAAQNYGNVESENGSFAGGIVGRSLSVIRECTNLGDISGINNIGGIAGKGTDIIKCISMARLTTDDGEKLGIIAGSADGDIIGNRFLYEDIGGIDGISYEGKAEPLTYEEISQIKGLPPVFSNLTVTFMVDDNVVETVEVEYGGSIDELPEVPEREGYRGQWEDFDFKNIIRSSEVHAEYKRWNSTVASEEKVGKKNKLLAEGSFTDDGKIIISEADAPAGEILEKEIIESLKFKVEGCSNCSEEHTIKYLLPETRKKTEVFILRNGEVIAPEVKLNGSYADFTAVSGDSIYIVKAPVPEMTYIYIALGAVLIVTVGFCLFRSKKKNKASEKEEEKTE